MKTQFEKMRLNRERRAVAVRYQALRMDQSKYWQLKREMDAEWGELTGSELRKLHDKYVERSKPWWKKLLTEVSA